MIKYEKIILNNGLTVIVHQDKNTPLAAFNLLYDVGSRDETPNKTGFAHLFEHLMFEGSINIPEFDKPLQEVGGTNNAFTSKDITNYYITLPAINIETAFWLESDRMFQLAFSEKSLEIQKNVVSEEFRQSYLNQPYGDSMLLLHPLAYKVHPYRWNPIGVDIAHIENASLDEVRLFFNTHYRPNRAVLSVSGNVDVDEIFRLSEKWFGSIPPNFDYHRKLPVEPIQDLDRIESVSRNVPADAIYKAYHMCKRMDDNYYVYDVISDLLANGSSSRLYQNLYKKSGFFNEIGSSISGSADNGLLYITGKTTSGTNIEIANKAIENEIQNLMDVKISNAELEKVINKITSVIMFSKMNIMNVAMNLAYYHWLGDVDLINYEIDKYRMIKPQQIQDISHDLFSPSNVSTLFYRANNK